MALSANTVWEVRPGGVDTNGGGFVTGASGTDHTLQDAAQYSVTDAVTAGTTTITSATANFGTDVVGNILYIQGGTGAIVAGWYQIAARASSTSITVDRSTGLTLGTGATLKIGGALASPGQTASLTSVIGMITFIKSGTYTVTTASTNVSGGCLAAGASTRWIGYNTTRVYGNTDTKPILILNAGVTSATFNTANSQTFYNIEFDGASQTTSRYSTSSASQFIRCTFKGFTAANNGNSFFCTATGNAAAAFGNGAVACEAYANTATPFAITGNGGSWSDCYSYGNTGATTDGFSPAINTLVTNCAAISNGRHGFFVTSTSGTGVVINSIAESNTGFGLSGNTAVVAYNFASYNNTSGRSTGLVSAQDINPLTPSASVFVDAANNNFALNNTAGAGALLRAVGFPATFPRGLTASYPDIGAAQHEETVTASETSHAFA